jgi:amino acid permease|tara:strand:+ start:1309 stop:1518 length:210 start_codon:yes stop_codon:yes gene_type:complete
MEFFTKIAPILIIIGLILVSIVLVIGLVSMLTKGDFNKKYSNKLMRLRVITQGIIVLIFALVFLIKFLD